MGAITREARLIETMVVLADTMATGYDIDSRLKTLVERCGELLDSTGAGILLLSPLERLQIAAAMGESPALFEILQIAAESGPALECVRTGRPTTVADIAAVGPWPEFRGAAFAGGFHSVHVLALRHRDTTIGAMALFRPTTGEPVTADLMAAQTLADVATIGILQERAAREAELAREHLHRALHSRVTIEQAKGVVASRYDLDMASAFDLIRDYARENRIDITEVAQQIVRRTVNL